MKQTLEKKFEQKKDQTTVNQPIILNTLEEKSSYVCANCGENIIVHMYLKKENKK